MSAGGGVTRALACSVLGVITGCGGASPLLHPAHVLPAGEVRATSGVSAQAAVGQLAGDLDRAYDLASRDPSLPGAPGSNADYAKGALVAAAVAPGLAPVVGARVGVGGAFEGGVTYTGRGARLDLRRAFQRKAVAVSVGAGLNAAFLGRPANPALPGVALGSARAYGIDVPLIAGWRSEASLYQAWAGLRGGYNRVTIAPVSSEPGGAATSNEMAADHLYFGALAGVAIGLGHVHVGLELDATWQVVTGTFNGTSTAVSGLVIAPASAIMWDF